MKTLKSVLSFLLSAIVLLPIAWILSEGIQMAAHEYADCYSSGAIVWILYIIAVIVLTIRFSKEEKY